MATPSASAALALPRWYAHGFNHASLYRAAAVLAAALPRPARLALATALAGVAARRLAAERAVVSANVARMRPDLPARGRAAMVDDVFRSFAICFADLVAANRREGAPGRLLAGVTGTGHLAAASQRGGVVVLTAHVGNWELAGRLLARESARPTHIVVAAEADPAVERFLRGGRSPIRFIVRRGPTVALPLFAALRRGELVAMQGDRALGNRGDVGVRFFGAEARFPLGPFVLARAAGARVLPAFCLLGGDRRYTIEIGAPIEVPPGGERAALERWVDVLEAVVRGHPAQWFNFFDVWSAAPAP